MKVFQKRSVAAVVMALAIAAGGAVYVLCLLISGEAREEAAQLTKKLRRR